MKVQSVTPKIIVPSAQEKAYTQLLVEIGTITVSDPVFMTNGHGLFDVFLANLPEKFRQHYNCNICRDFFTRFGQLVTVDKKGNKTPLLATIKAPAFFRQAIAAVVNVVQATPIESVFYSSENFCGTAKTGEWSHPSFKTPKQCRVSSFTQDFGQMMAVNREEYKMLHRLGYEFRPSQISRAIDLLKNDPRFKQADKHVWLAEKALEVISAGPGDIVWHYAAILPSGVAHFKNSVVGALVKNLQDGKSVSACAREWNEMLHPLQYMRPQAPATEGNIEAAERIVAKLGIERSLERRYARADEVPLLWVPKHPARHSGVFSALRRGKEPQPLSAGHITWVKFYRDVLGSATSMEMCLRPGNYAAIVTATHADAPPILKWDREELRNPFNWYLYHGGSRPHDWNLGGSDSWCSIVGVTARPDLYTIGGKGGVVLILDGCRDTRNGGLALFPDTLRPELREIRATIEEFSRQGRISGGVGTAQLASGYMLQEADEACNIKVKVTVGSVVKIYTIDRWE